MRILLGTIIYLFSAANARTAIMPPPWADPSSNPCAAQPRGWQLLYWPADGKCYKIFQVDIVYSSFSSFFLYLVGMIQPTIHPGYIAIILENFDNSTII